MTFTQGNTVTLPGVLAGAAITQWSVAKFASTVGEVVIANTTSVISQGICVNDPADGEPAQIVVSGITKAVAGTSTITAGESLGHDTTGRVVDIAVNTTTAKRPLVGRAMEASAAVGDLIRIKVNPMIGGG